MGITRKYQDSADVVIIHDAIGQGIDVELVKTRGIVSVVLIDSENAIPIGPSGEIQMDDLLEALKILNGEA